MKINKSKRGAFNGVTVNKLDKQALRGLVPHLSKIIS